ncbi:MAG: MBL fold metallo-hydrolase RNA specificity domain-containing protein [Nitrososphaeraceae archaeon]
MLEDYDSWEEQFLGYSNKVDCRDLSTHQSDFIFYCNDFHLQELVDIKPHEKLSYIRSSAEPFDDEMRFDEIRVKRWLAHFGLLIDKKMQMHRTHVSGHASGDQIKKVIEGSTAKTVIPIPYRA